MELQSGVPALRRMPPASASIAERPAPAPAVPADPFAALNAAQRAAVEHGLDGASAGPLLVIAGAGSGKTLTLASRVARLVLAGADPQRILLLTFSRRAALEMERRVGRALHGALGVWLDAATAATALGRDLPRGRRAAAARIRSAAIGLGEAFTIDDRGDAEDLMGLGAPGPRAGRDARIASRPRATCLAIYSRAVNSRRRWPRRCSGRTRGARPGTTS